MNKICNFVDTCYSNIMGENNYFSTKAEIKNNEISTGFPTEKLDHIVLYCLVWSRIVPYGTIWSTMVLYGPVWSHMVPYGPVWFRMVLHSPVCSCMVPYGPVQSV